ncbi:heterokaryon incompatibility protein-domain-containing protein [Boeremia exigua]|uniref:heterokaryon incompatibility protein-domain-containing protein n=1 Tax=Boeremia exigua TaxID=749465 RepID=UPI001E8E99F6|nr:heterokaryon incompatibility protein-domain-containing protein [Boeremia exigua]KAH6622236.1 heterokaryon incompatibility protein-domain-containing protein [Boeremia exigua]
MDAYTYDELPADCFRYLILLPGANSDPLRCSLHTSNINEARYESLSYVWGTDVRDHEIMCDNSILKITSNLHQVLQRVRLTDAPRNIWADSICINQEDLQEKSRQVTIMGQIYCNAERVMICMGADREEHGPNVLALLQDIREMINAGLVHATEGSKQKSLVFRNRESAMWNTFPYSDSKAPLLNDSRWASINALVEQEWFHRGWVVREAGLARQALVLWGQTEFLWNDLMQALVWRHRRAVTSITIQAEDRFRSHLEAYEALHKDAIRIFYHKSSWKACSLLNYLHFARALRLKDPRDRIYAFLDLAEDSVRELCIIPNYADPPMKVYRDFAIQYVYTTGKVDILHYVKHDDSLSESTLMSWVPDWSKEEKDVTGFVAADENNPPLLSRTKQTSNPKLLNGTTLEVDGVILGSVQWTSNVLQSKTTTLVVLFELWTAVYKSISESPYPTTHLLEQLFDTLAALSFVGEIHAWYTFRKKYINIFTVLHTQMQETGKIEVDADEVATLESTTFHGFISSATSGKRVIVTERGYIGIRAQISRDINEDKTIPYQVSG